MNFAAPQDVQLPKPIMGYFPATFLERGVATPFTTPDLAGTRVRPGQRVPLELLVPNLSGARGVYILPWTDIQALCRPTLHDLRLIDVVAEQRYITPADIRTAALQVAHEGLAGREAAAAARACRSADQRGLLDTYFELLLTLLPQVEPQAGEARPPEQDTLAGLETRTRAAMAVVAPELGLTVHEMARLLEEIAALYMHLGVGAQRARARARIPSG
jgi:hypothetical protein